MMNELPPFWNLMKEDHKKDWVEGSPYLREQLIKFYELVVPRQMEDPNILKESVESGNYRGQGLLEGDIPLPPNWGNLVDPKIGANHPDSLWYELPSEQGLLEYGTQRGDGLTEEGHPAWNQQNTYMYPQNAPNTPEHRQAYNFLRRNNFGGGI
jgi:hypothetical protein